MQSGSAGSFAIFAGLACGGLAVVCVMAQTVHPNRVNVDEVLDDIVGPRGLWQALVLLVICFSLSSPVMFPIYTNAVPKFRCALDPISEAKLTLSNETKHLDFDAKARLVGPWFAANETMSSNQGLYGCLRYKGGLNFSHSLNNGMPTEPCIDGYVYEPMENQYPSTIVAEWDLVCEDSWKAPFSTSIYMLGMMVGFIFGGFLGGSLGRKKAIYIAGFLEAIFGFSVTFSPNFATYTTLRFSLSAACTAKVASIMVILVELTTASNRAIFSAGFSFFVNFLFRGGHAVIAMFIQQWRYLHLAIMAPAFLGVITLLFVPESPRWLVSKSRGSDALKVLYQGYKVNKAFKRGPKLTEAQFMQEAGHSSLAVESSESNSKSRPSAGLKSFFIGFTAAYQNREVAKRSLICTLLFVGQLCAFFGLLFYTRVIRGSVFYVAMVNAATSLPATLLSPVLYCQVKSRKKPLISIYASSAIVLLIGGAYSVIAEPESDIFLIVCCNIALVLLGASLNMLFIYIPELFPSSIRTQGLGNAAGLGRIGSILCAFVNQLDLMTKHGVPVIIYGGVLVLQILLTFCIPDTDGENLADIVIREEN